MPSAAFGDSAQRNVAGRHETSRQTNKQAFEQTIKQTIKQAFEHTDEQTRVRTRSVQTKKDRNKQTSTQP